MASVYHFRHCRSIGKTFGKRKNCCELLLAQRFLGEFIAETFTVSPVGSGVGRASWRQCCLT